MRASNNPVWKSSAFWYASGVGGGEADKVASFLLGDGLGEMLGEMLCVVLIEALELQLGEVPGVVLGVVLMS